jgi:hypothetical protein
MEQKWIDQFNKKCAEFLGYKSKERIIHTSQYADFDKPRRGLVFDVGVKKYSIEKLRFHSDWNWIHVVVEKVNEVILSKEHDEKEIVLVHLRHNIRDYLGASLKIPVVRAINEFLDKHLEYYGN